MSRLASDRRSEERTGSPSRRKVRRPALWFNLLILSLGLSILAGAQQHRRRLDTEFDRFARTQVTSPYELGKIRNELVSMKLTRESLDGELRNRLAMAKSFEAAEFYLAIDTTHRKLRLHFGPETLREVDVVIGEPRVVEAEGKTWRFVPLKGGLTVIGKLVDEPWDVPPWAYAMNDMPIPSSPSIVPGGLGKYVILLPNGYIIHSPAVKESPLQGAKPGSFMIAEEQMHAIWPRVTLATRVYVY